MIDWNAVATGLGSIGGFAIVGKWLIRGVEKSNESIPVMLDNLKTQGKAIEELFKDRNTQALQIKEIQVGIEYCDACNAHRHRRSGDKQGG